MKKYSNSKIRQEYYVHRMDENGNAQISNGGLFGVIDNDEKIIIPCIYQIILPTGKLPVQYDPGVLCFGEEGYAAVKLNRKWGVVDRANQMILPCVYDKVLSYSEGVFNVMNNELCATIDKEGKTIIDFKYTQILPFKDGYAICYNVIKGYGTYSEKHGIVDKSGKIIFDTEFAQIFSLPSGFLAGTEKYSYSFSLDREGNRTPIEKIKYVENFSDEWAVFYTPEDRSGIISHEGKIILAAEYNGIFKGRKYFYAYKSQSEGDKTYFIIDKYGAIVKQIEGVDWVHFWHDIIFFEIRTEKYKSMYGLMDEDLNVILPATYNNLRWVASGLVCAETENFEQVLIDYSGKRLMTIDDPVYNLGLSYGFTSLPILVSVNGIHLQIDNKANVLNKLPYSFIYQGIEYFGDKPYCLHYAYMGVKLDKRSTIIGEEKIGATGGILDGKLNVVITPKYTTISNLKKHKDLFVVSLGEEIVTYDEDGDPSVASGRKFGVINKKEEFIIPPIYERVIETSYNLFLVHKGGESVFDREEYEWYHSGGKKGLVNLQGAEVVPPIYEGITIYDYIFAYYQHPTVTDNPKYDVYDLFGNKVRNDVILVVDENKPINEYY